MNPKMYFDIALVARLASWSTFRIRATSMSVTDLMIAAVLVKPNDLISHHF